LGRHTITVDIAAPREQVFALFTNLERAPEWIEGMAGVSDVSGPADQAGTTYVNHFGTWATSVTTVLAAERPRHHLTKFGNWLLRGENEATFDEIDGGNATRLTQEFRTNGIIPAIASWIFAHGSYKGSFRGELNTLKAICEREAGKGEKVSGP
jgi:uncharacterized protein YndB with AHSA1/START domain